MAGPSASLHAEPWWVRASYLTAAVVAVLGDWLFISADAGSNRAWTAYLGTYLALAAALAIIGAVAPRGVARSAGRGVAAGAATAFVLLGAASIGVLFIPLAGWLGVSTIGGNRAKRHLGVTAFGLAAGVVVPILGLFVVYNR